MKVLLIDVNCKYGSTGKIVYSLYNHVNSNGDEAAICYGRGPRVKEKNIFRFGLGWETFFHAFLTRLTGYTGCFSFFSTLRLIRFIKKFKPDVVHIHELHAYFVNINSLLSFLKKQNVKVVHTLHCAFSYTGKCGHHLDCEKWKECCGNCPRLHEYVSTLLFDHTKSMFIKKKKAFGGFANMTIVCPSQWLASFASLSYLGNYPIKVINNGIDTRVFCPKNDVDLKKRLDIADSTKIVLSVAPNIMSDAKGGKWILKLADMMANDDVVFILVGLDKESMLFPKNVLAFQRTNNQNELADFYNIANAFVICSEMENLPTTCLESQCCGTPIFGFDVGGIKETSVCDGNAFVPYGDIESLCNAIRESFNSFSNEKRHQIALLASERFSATNMKNSYNILYKS